MKTTKVGNILNRLMAEKKIRVAELARRIDLPQPTVHRIATGACEHPHLSSLEPLANFFAITVPQLKGHEPIPWLDRVTRVPMITWGEVMDWSVHQPDRQYDEYVLTDALVGKAGYAIKIVDASMEPVFPKNTVLIADADKQARDRSYVIAKLAHCEEAVFRQLLVDAGECYLKPLSPDFDQYKMTRLNQNDKILSIVVQAKRDCEN